MQEYRKLGRPVSPRLYRTTEGAARNGGPAEGDQSRRIIPAQTGILWATGRRRDWIPACAGTTPAWRLFLLHAQAQRLPPMRQMAEARHQALRRQQIGRA